MRATSPAAGPHHGPIPAPPAGRPASASTLVAFWTAVGPMSLEVVALGLFQLLDIYWLGRLGPAAVAAAGIAVSLRWALASLAMGQAVGGMVVVGRSAGERDLKAASIAAWQTILLSLCLSAALSVAGFILAPRLQQLLRIGQDVWPLALTYLRLTCLGLLPLTLVLTVNALWRGTGAARTACAVLGLAAGIGAALEPLLIFGCRLGVAGAGLAAVLGPVAGAVVQLILLSRGHAGLRLEPGTLCPAPRLLVRLARLGWPHSLHLFLRGLARVALIALAGRFGTAAIAAYTIAGGLSTPLLIPSYALGNVAAVLVPRKLRAGFPGQALRNARAIGFVNLAYVSAVVAALFALAPRAVAAFSADPRVQTLGADALCIMGLGYISSSLGVVMARGLDATGHVVPTAATNVLALWGIQVPAAALLGHLLGVDGMWLGLAIGSVANGLLLSYRFRRGPWRKAG